MGRTGNAFDRRAKAKREREREQERTLFEAPRLVGAALPLAPQRDGRARVRVPVVAQVEAVLRACEEHPADHSGADEEVDGVSNVIR